MGTFIWKLYLIFSLLEVVNNLVGRVDGQSHAFIQVDNELKYLVDGVAIHMNEGLVPMDLLPELADICTHHLATHWTSQSSRPSFQSCSNLRQRLDLRDCDPSQDGLLNPSTCLHIMQNTYLPEVVADSDYCSVKLCSNQDPSDGCVAVQMTTTLNHACVPHHLLDDLVYGGVPSTVHKSQEAHFIHVRKEEETLLLNLESHQLREIMLEQIKESCSPKQETNMASSASPSEHHCWNMSKEGPKPGLSCLLRPLWLPPQIIKTGETEIRYGDIIDDKGVPSKNYIVFDPPHLDFKEHPTGMPLMRKVVVQNSSPENSVQLHSLSGNTLHFHCTFFQDKVVLPGGNTSFDVVFLGREEGLIENTIFIHTSIGTYKYGVRAVGTGNPYRLRPLVGVRMPLNSSYSPLIQLHNPHPHSLQITEMYSTGGDLHLELLSGTQEGQKNVWNIPPYHTRALMRANFVARRENNHTAYVRISTGENDSDYLVVPVEVEVSGQPGLFCPHDGLHFGLRTPHDPPSSLPLHLLNSAHKHIHIQNVITTPVNDAITIDFKPMKIPPGTVRPTQVATVTFDPSKATSGKKISGKILIKSKVSAYKLSVPYTVDLLQGALLYNTSITKFYTGADIGSSESQSGVSYGTVAGVVAAAGGVVGGGGGTSNPSSEPRNLTLTNTFPCPVVIYNLTLPEEAKRHFEIKSNTVPLRAATEKDSEGL